MAAGAAAFTGAANKAAAASPPEVLSTSRLDQSRFRMAFFPYVFVEHRSVVAAARSKAGRRLAHPTIRRRPALPSTVRFQPSPERVQIAFRFQAIGFAGAGI